MDYTEQHADFDNAEKGFVATLSPMTITTADGRRVFSADDFAFINGEAPSTVHPGLWRQSKLTAKHGLFEVAPGFYQVRGFDISNMTIVEGDTGVIVIDPLISAETASAAIKLYRDHRGDRPVTAVIYTHAHIDHFGGVLGVVESDTTVPIVAPEHFLEHAVSENVYAGTAMLRRGQYYAGTNLGASAEGAVGIGLGPVASEGTVGLLAPTVDVTHTGQELTLDGVRIVFQLTPNTESPAEMNFSFPDHRVLCMAENTTHTLHNLLTLRGAQVRDARIWSRYIAEAIDLFGHDTDVAIASHHWPTWGTENILAFLTAQRDLYAFLHDQTLRLMNQGYTGIEIAEMIEVPESLAADFGTHGYYGSVSHNVKAIYQRYVGWYDGNPAHLWQHPPQAQGERYVELLGGIDETVAAARRYVEAGDLRFAVELASHAVFANPSDAGARDVLAGALRQLGFGSENATWRNAFLMGAAELGRPVEPTTLDSDGILAALTITQLFDTIAIRIDGVRAAGTSASILWKFTDSGESYRTELSNGAFIHYPTTRVEPSDASVALTRPQLLRLLGTGSTEHLEITGDAEAITTVLALTDKPDPGFDIVTS
jgi:alkyl sulfatase BDS1-like metallo-beta-lactamase superfamily hydrolase